MCIVTVDLWLLILLRFLCCLLSWLCFARMSSLRSHMDTREASVRQYVAQMHEEMQASAGDSPSPAGQVRDMGTTICALIIMRTSKYTHPRLSAYSMMIRYVQQLGTSVCTLPKRRPSKCRSLLGYL